jgi:uncharacterized protein YbjT (DUF2867 family)
MDIFVTGGTGYLGRAMIGVSLNRGHAVRALTGRRRWIDFS